MTRRHAGSRAHFPAHFNRDTSPTRKTPDFKRKKSADQHEKRRIKRKQKAPASPKEPYPPKNEPAMISGSGQALPSDRSGALRRRIPLFFFSLRSFLSSPFPYFYHFPLQVGRRQETFEEQAQRMIKLIRGEHVIDAVVPEVARIFRFSFFAPLSAFHVGRKGEGGGRSSTRTSQNFSPSFFFVVFSRRPFPRLGQAKNTKKKIEPPDRRPIRKCNVLRRKPPPLGKSTAVALATLPEKLFRQFPHTLKQ